MLAGSLSGFPKSVSHLFPLFVRRRTVPALPLESRDVTAHLPKTSWKHTRPFRLGEFEVLPASGELRGPRGIQRVRPLLMDILLRLAAEPGEVVRRETLLDDVWPRRMVNDEVLSRAIAELRTALGDDARDSRYIETLPKIGYRLLASVDEAIPASTPAQPAPAPVVRPSGPAIPGKMPIVVAAFVGAIAVAAWFVLQGSREPAGAGIERVLLGARPFTSDPALELGPRFSRDGRFVTFALGAGAESRIVVQSVADSTRQVIGGAGVLRLSPVFFPDGRRLAYWRGENRDCAIVEHDLATGTERTLLDCALRPRPRFDLSPDGRWLVFSATPRPQFPSGVQVLELATGRTQALTTPEPGTGDDLLPRFSPDGRRIAFFRGSDSHSSVWTVAREDAASAKAAAKLEGLVYGLAWLGDEGPLLVAADWLGFRALNVLEIRTGEARLAGARGARYPDVGPHGEIVYENAVYTANLFRVALGGDAKPEPLWTSTRYTNQPEYSADGRRVVFTTNRDGVDAIYVSDGYGEPRRIAGAAEYRYFRPHWSADGRFVYAIRTAVQRAGPPRQEAVRIAADGGALHVLNTLGGTVNDVRETADGRFLLWGELSGYSMRLLRAPISDPTRVERLPWPLVSQFQVHGDRVVHAQPNMTALTSCRLSTLACEPLAMEVGPLDLFHWTLGPRAVYVRARGAQGVSRYDLATGRVTSVATLGPTGAGTSLAVSPDEKTLLVVREEGPAVDLMIAKP